MFAWFDCHNYPLGEVEMVAKDLLIVGLYAALSAAVSWGVHDIVNMTEYVECRVHRVVDSEDDEPTVNDNGTIPRPYTIVTHNPQYRLIVLPGVAGKVGDLVMLRPDW